MTTIQERRQAVYNGEENPLTQEVVATYVEEDITRGRHSPEDGADIWAAYRTGKSEPCTALCAA
jgi:hypothetical protein